MAYVNASDGLLFYDSSNELYCTYFPSSVYNWQEEDPIIVSVAHKRISVRNARAGSKIECIGISGEIFKTLVAAGGDTSFDVEGYTGVAFVRITGNGRGSIFKVHIK